MKEGRPKALKKAISYAAEVAEIKQIYNLSHKTAGYRKVHATLSLKRSGFTIYRVKKIMHENSITSIVKLKYKPQMTKADPSTSAFKNLLNQNFRTQKKNEVWVADMTYIRAGFKWTYLAVVIDLYNREPVGWAYDSHPDASLACKALEMAIRRERPPKGLIHHSDRGSQYTSKAYKVLMKKYQITGSMSRKGNCYDNAVVESFFKALKTEWTNHCCYSTMKEAYESLYHYIEVFYKYQRLHEALGYKTPKNYEKQRKLAV